MGGEWIKTQDSWCSTVFDNQYRQRECKVSEGIRKAVKGDDFEGDRYLQNRQLIPG